MFALNTNQNPRTGVNSRRFGWDLVKSLVTPYMARRKSDPKGLQRNIIRKIEIFLPPSDDVVECEQNLIPASRKGLFPHARTADHKRRCIDCLKNLPGDSYRAAKSKLTKVRTQCSRCANAACDEHTKMICLACIKDSKLSEPTNSALEIDITFVCCIVYICFQYM